MVIPIVKWIVLATLAIVITIVNVVFSPFICLFINTSGYLPKFLSWFQTPDNPAIGDKSFQDNQLPWTKKLPDWLARYCLGIGWALRNPAYGYDKWAGFEVNKDYTYSSSGNENVDTFRDYLGICHVIEGYVLRKLNHNSCNYFQFTILYRYSWNRNRAWRISIGWTLSKHNIETLKFCKVNTTINPWIDCSNGSL